MSFDIYKKSVSKAVEIDCYDFGGTHSCEVIEKVELAEDFGEYLSLLITEAVQ